MKEFNMTGLRERLDQLSTDELDAMLNAELERDEPDPASVRLLMDILEGKDIAPVEITPKKEAAWKRYQERVKGLKKKSSRSKGWLLKVASIVLAAGLLFAMVPQDAEAESLWDVLVRWSNSAMEIFGITEKIPEYQLPFDSKNKELLQLHDAVIEIGVERPLIPTWFPEEYLLKSCDEFQMPKAKLVSALFSDGKNEAVFRIVISEEANLSIYFGEEQHHSQYEREGTKYTIMRNNDCWAAVWQIDKTEYFLTMDCQEDTLLRILDSIYVMED